MKRKIPGIQINISENNGIKVVWDIDSIISEIKGAKTKEFSVDKLYNEKDKIDTSYAMQTDLRFPIIVARLNDEKYEIVDGKHRLYKAMMTGRKEIEAYCIESDNLSKYIMEDEEIIRKYLGLKEENRWENVKNG